MRTGNIKGRDIPEGYVACGCTGRAVNVGVSVDQAYRAETARQRWLWNHFLSMQIDTYQCLGEFVFYHGMARQLTLLRKSNAWIGAGGIAAQQATLRDLERSLKDSFPSASNRKGFPRFRKTEDRRDRMTVPARELGIVKLGDGTVTHVRFPKQPLIRAHNLKVPPGGRITKASISMDGSGWRVSLGIVIPLPEAPSPTVDGIGVDVGLTLLAVTSDGEFIENPKPLKKALERLQRASRKLSRRAEGSIGRKRAAKAVARIHRRVADIRRGNHHRVSRRIVDRAAHISVETISAKGMMQGWNPRSSADAALGELLRQIEYKAVWARRGFYKLGRFERSTGCCPNCDWIGPRLALGVRTWTCGGCGAEHDRDLAAACWIDKVGRRSPEPVKASAPQSPKRGSAMRGGGATSVVPSRRGPPANVPRHAAIPARVSTG